MKKFVVGVAVAIATLIMCMCLVGCGASGTYKFDSMTIKYGATETTVKAGEDYEGKKLDADSMVLELNSDKTWKMTSSLMGESEEAETGTWEEKDGKIILSQEGSNMTVELTKDGSKLILEQSMGALGSMKFTLSK